MKSVIERKELSALFNSIKAVFEQNEELLCEMDARIGDGDLGLTMKRGFSAAWEFIRDSEEPSIGKAISKAGLKMSSAAPSTMGTLMASGLMQAGKALGEAERMDTEGFNTFVSGFEEGIAKRGKSSRGQCTVLDSIGPAADAVRAACAGANTTLPQLAELAYQGATDGAESTADMQPVYGKAAVHQNKSHGVIDQGAYAGQCFYEGIYKYICM